MSSRVVSGGHFLHYTSLMEDLCSKWDGMIMNEEEDSMEAVGEVVLFNGKQYVRLILLERLLTDKPYEDKALKSAMCRLWDSKTGLDINYLQKFGLDMRQIKRMC